MNLGELTAQQIEEELGHLSPAMRDWYRAKIQAVNDWNPSESPEPDYPMMPIEEPKAKRKRKPKPFISFSQEEWMAAQREAWERGFIAGQSSQIESAVHRAVERMGKANDSLR